MWDGAPDPKHVGPTSMVHNSGASLAIHSAMVFAGMLKSPPITTWESDLTMNETRGLSRSKVLDRQSTFP